VTEPSSVINSDRALAEVCVNPRLGEDGIVGLIAMSRHPLSDWTELTPAEARRRARALNVAADAAELEVTQ
jgi:hypothetical protein